MLLLRFGLVGPVLGAAPRLGPEATTRFGAASEGAGRLTVYRAGGRTRMGSSVYVQFLCLSLVTAVFVTVAVGYFGLLSVVPYMY